MNYKKLFAAGFITWLIPFLVSIFFFDREGTLLIDKGLFKSIMLILGSTTGALSLIWIYSFMYVTQRNTLIAAFSLWFINIILDLLILIPISNQPVEKWFLETGLVYTVIPIYAITMGEVLLRKPTQ